MAIDKEKVREVILFAENDYKSYEVLMNTYLPNLLKKRIAGKYDRKQAPKLLEYYYQNYVRPSMKNPRNYGYDPKLNPQERAVFSKYFSDYLWEEHIKSVRPKTKTKGIAKSKRKLK
jgi:hypothetical protein